MKVLRTESFDSWILKGMHQRLPDDAVCLNITAHESCSPLLPWLRKAWQKQGLETRFLLASELDIVELEVFLETGSLQPQTMLVVTLDIEPSRRIYGRIIELCSAYQGLHRIILLFTAPQKPPAHNNVVVEIPKVIDYNLFAALSLIINHNIHDKQTIEAFFGRVIHCAPKLTLAQACTVIPYIDALGRSREHFYTAWLPALLKANPSLFTMSQHLLARDGRSFYAAWNDAYPRYPDEFWLVYWSDQFWQAYRFIMANNSASADQSSFTKGLPFSFTQRGWRNYKAEFFAELVELMYDYDCYAKQGGLLIPYELLFNKIIWSR